LKKICTMIFLLVLLAGCSSAKDLTSTQVTPTMDHEGMSSTQASSNSPSSTPASTVSPSSTPETKKQYSLDATITQEGENYFINAKTDLTFSQEHYNGSHIYGEGHIHFYLNGSLIGPIMNAAPYKISPKGDPTYILGENKIKLVLAGNDHSEVYNASKELSIDKKAE
jgi:hypothetical protein